MASLDSRPTGLLILFSVFFAALSGLLYELVAGTLSSYLLGGSVTQFSVVIGVFLSSMGAGAFLSRYVQSHLLASFIALEIWVGLIGGLIAPLGFIAFTYTDVYTPILLFLVVVVGILVGAEIPLVIRILEKRSTLRLTLANVLGIDYIGALAASLAFPFLILPSLGLMRAGLAAGLLNVGVGGLLLWHFRSLLGKRFSRLRALALGAAVFLSAVFIASGSLSSFLENQLYQDEIIYSKTSPYQKIVLTRWKDDTRLYLNGHLQFSSIDEYRYHETLVLPALGAVLGRAPVERVLVLGGGDGLALRQLLKEQSVQSIKLVDLDETVTTLFKTRPYLQDLNGNALNDPRVRIENRDAMRALEEDHSLYDLIVMDLPDPSEPGLAKLYSTAFFRLVTKHLRPHGVLVTQATSPFRARQAFWSIVHTLEKMENRAMGRLHVRPYHTTIPTFGSWGFVMASWQPVDLNKISLPSETQFLTEAVLSTLFAFPRDVGRLEAPVNDLNSPKIVELYRRGYHRYLD